VLFIVYTHDVSSGFKIELSLGDIQAGMKWPGTFPFFRGMIKRAATLPFAALATVFWMLTITLKKRNMPAHYKFNLAC